MGSGHKNKRGKNKGNRHKNKKIAELKKKPDDQVYAKIKGARGNRRFEVEAQNLENPEGAHITMNRSLSGSLRMRAEADMFVLVEPTDSEKVSLYGFIQLTMWLDSKPLVYGISLAQMMMIFLIDSPQPLNLPGIRMMKLKLKMKMKLVMNSTLMTYRLKN